MDDSNGMLKRNHVYGKGLADQSKGSINTTSHVEEQGLALVSTVRCLMMALSKGQTF